MKPVRRDTVDRMWVAKICEDLGYDPREVLRIKMDGHVVTVTRLRRDANGDRLLLGERCAHEKIEHPIVGDLVAEGD